MLRGIFSYFYHKLLVQEMRNQVFLMNTFTVFNSVFLKLSEENRSRRDRKKVREGRNKIQLCIITSLLWVK